MKTATLEQLWCYLRLQLSLRAEGSTTNLDRDRVSQGKSDSKAPPSAGEELRELEKRWIKCRTNRDREAVLRDGIEDIKLHGQPKPAANLRRDTLEWKQAIATDPRPSRKVAETYEVSHATVCEYRKKFGGAKGTVERPSVRPAEPLVHLREQLGEAGESRRPREVVK